MNKKEKKLIRQFIKENQFLLNRAKTQSTIRHYQGKITAYRIVLDF